jgi:hypothetical protein
MGPLEEADCGAGGSGLVRHSSSANPGAVLGQKVWFENEIFAPDERLGPLSVEQLKGVVPVVDEEQAPVTGRDSDPEQVTT